MKTYTIKCNRLQIQFIAEALEMYARMKCGQLGRTYMPPINEELWKLYKDKSPEIWSTAETAVEKRFDEIKHIIWGLVPNASYGIGYDADADLCYETYKIILSQFEKERAAIEGDKYRGNVHTGTPLKLTNQPFIEVTMEEDNKKEIELNQKDKSKSKNEYFERFRGTLPNEPYHIGFRYDHYCQGTDEVYVERVVYANSFEDACTKIKTTTHECKDKKKAWYEYTYPKARDFTDLTIR